MQATTMLDPTAEVSPVEKQLLPRLTSLEGATVGLLDISKPRGKQFLDEVEQQLTSRGAVVKRYTKPTFARIAPTELSQRISVECDAVIEGLADWGSCTSCSLHDIMNLEGRGLPAGFVASAEFVEAARVQGDALGIHPASVFVPHPIQDRSDEEMADLAREAIDQIVALVTQ